MNGGGGPLQNVVPHLINRPLPLIVVWIVAVVALTFFEAAPWIYLLITVGLVLGIVLFIRSPHLAMQDEYMARHLNGPEPEAAQALDEDDAEHPPSDELDAIRLKEYTDNRGLFLVHTWELSEKKNEIADVVIRLQEHLDTSRRPSVLKGGKVDCVRYQLGRNFSDEPFVKRDPEGGFPLSVSAYKPMLCVAEVIFKDEHKPIRLSRYIDFPVGSS